MADINQSLNTLERREAEIDRELDRVIINITSGITALVDQIQREGITDVGIIKSEVIGVIDRSGYNQFLENILNDDYQESIDTAFEMYQTRLGQDLQIDDEFLTQLNSKKQSDSEIYNSLVTSLVAKTTTTLSNAGFVNVGDTIIREDLEKSLTTFSNQNKTEVTETLFGAFTIASIGLAVNGGMNKFLYAGTLIPTSRSFCRLHIGQVKTKDEWFSLDNGQRPISMGRPGGYNCRHSLVGV